MAVCNSGGTRNDVVKRGKSRHEVVVEPNDVVKRGKWQHGIGVEKETMPSKERTSNMESV